MAPIELAPVDRIRITILIDNLTDPPSCSTEQC
jgi:hypothetical protein